MGPDHLLVHQKYTNRLYLPVQQSMLLFDGSLLNMNVLFFLWVKLEFFLLTHHVFLNQIHRASPKTDQ